MIRSILIDDEPKLREVLKIKLNHNCPSVDVIGEASTVDDAYDKINLLKPNAIFLDIAMTGETGFDLIDRFSHIDFEIIFVTGFNTYAMEAMQASAVDYILKPIKTDHLISAIEKVTRKLEGKKTIEKYQVLKHNLSPNQGQQTKIAIPGTDAYDFVKIENIIRCEGWQKYTRIHLQDGTVLVSSYNIGVFKNMLEKHDFYSTHKSHLINKKHIQKYHKDGTLILSDGSSVPVARRKKELFLDQIFKVLKLA